MESRISIALRSEGVALCLKSCVENTQECSNTILLGYLALASLIQM